MRTAIAAFALAAMSPAMADGALHAASGDPLMLALCSGGSISLNPDAPAQPRPANAPCCAKGCHSGERKRKAGAVDPAQ
jgi:hypothetical protein